MIRVLDNPFYYLDNFHQVLQWIGDRYRDLLNEEENTFLQRFPALPQPARALFVRMVMRKGELFRASKLSYPEIGCTIAAAGPQGFGYDPVFQPEGYDVTFGEMSAAQKHGWKPGEPQALSHRARAFKIFVETCLEA